MSVINPLDRTQLAVPGLAPGSLDLGTSGRFMLRPRSVLLDQNPSKILTSNRRRYGAYLYNGGGKLELPIDLGAGLRQGAALPLQTFIDSAGIQVASYALSSYKLLTLIVDVAFAWVTAAQATLQLIVGRGPWSPQSSSSTQTGGNFQNFLKGAAANLGGAGATSLATGIYVFSPTDIADLQWPHPWVGAEIKVGSALTAGAARLFMGMPLGPAVLLGNSEAINPDPGDKANSMLLPPQSPWAFVPTDRELWAMATPGGTADLRIWEVLNPDAAGAAVAPAAVAR